MSKNPLFPALADPSQALDPRIRKFPVVDPLYVVVDGLEKIESVWIDGVHIPMTVQRPMAKRDPGRQEEMAMVELPVLTVQDVPGVGRCLIRSVLSNNGVWQSGSVVTVLGEWADEDSEHFLSSRVVNEELTKLQTSHMEALERKNKEIERLKSGAKTKEPSDELEALRAKHQAELDAKDKEIEELKKLSEKAPKTEKAQSS